MCGIAGLYSTSPTHFDASTLIKMSQSMAHRGPDDEGFVLMHHDGLMTRYHHEHTHEASIQRYNLPSLTTARPYMLALMHRRLSIIDLSPMGHQPMSYDDGNLWIVFNGEIYNYLELKIELEDEGYIFASHSDTEILLAGYKAWGEQVLNKLNGMWAFTIFDKGKNLLFSARDKTGVKPFYYIDNALYFAFASEIKTLVTTPGLSKKQLNHKAVWDYLIWGIIERTEHSFWNDVTELKPAHYLIKDLSSGSLSLQCYYTPNYQNNEGIDNNSQNHAKHISTLLQQAVGLRLNSDVPVGVSLSGGMDSSSICALAQKEYTNRYNRNISAYTVSFPDFVDDETAFAQQVAVHTGVDWHKVTPDTKISPEMLEKMIYHQDLPFLSISLYSHFKLIEKVAKDGIKVFLEGQGGDELFSGYPHHNIAYLRERLKHADLKGFIHTLSNHDNSGFSKSYLIKSLLKAVLLDAFGQGTEHLLINHHKEFEVLSPEFKKAFMQSNTYATYKTKNLHQSLEYDTYGYYLKFLLRATDRTSMAHGVECRTTFADEFKLIDYVNHIPSRLKIQNGYPKYLLRKAMEDLLPASIIWRKDKKGFASPEQQWIVAILEDFDKYLEQDLSEFFDLDKLKLLLNNFKSNPHAYYDKRIWRIINFVVWKKIFLS